MTTDADALREAGWTSRELDSFSGIVGPLWQRGEEAAFRATEAHGNGHIGVVHGGLLATFADIFLGSAVARRLGGPRCVTVHLQLHYVAAARIGALVVGSAEIVRQTRSLVFVRGLIEADGRTVASADGIWKVLERKAG